MGIDGTGSEPGQPGINVDGGAVLRNGHRYGSCRSRHRHPPRWSPGRNALRILVTNDDGVRAPGIAALARVAAASGHDVVVVAPMVDYSGAGAAVGPVHSRDGVDYETFEIDGLGGVPTYGI